MPTPSAQIAPRATSSFTILVSPENMGALPSPTKGSSPSKIWIAVTELSLTENASSLPNASFPIPSSSWEQPLFSFSIAKQRRQRSQPPSSNPPPPQKKNS